MDIGSSASECSEEPPRRFNEGRGIIAHHRVPGSGNYRESTPRYRGSQLLSPLARQDIALCPFQNQRRARNLRDVVPQAEQAARIEVASARAQLLVVLPRPVAVRQLLQVVRQAAADVVERTPRIELMRALDES